MTLQQHQRAQRPISREAAPGRGRPERRGPLPEWLTRWSVLLACLATAVVHLLYLTRQLGVDEGGFAMVARFWRSGGHFLYGPSWVDRPPGLIAVFAAAERLGPYGVRLAAAGLAVVLVAAVASAADAIGGRPAARWAAWTGFALVSSMLFQAERLNGELVAATFVAVSMAAVIRAVRVSRGGVHAALLGLLAGAAAGAAVLAKQNFVDGFAFAVVLLVVGSLTRVNRRVFRPVLVVTTAAAFLAGALLPAAGALLWARSHGGAGAMAYAMYGFRSDAAAVIANWSWHAPLHRLGVLLAMAGLSGLLLLLGNLAWRHGRRLRHLDPLPWALTAAVVVELAGVAGGENFWPHYLIALIPTVALATGLGVHRRMPGRTWTRRLVLAAVLSTAVVSPLGAVHGALASSPSWTVGRWLAASAAPRDTVVVTYTHANLINASGLRPGYPYAWSLPIRTLDPHLSRLVRTLDGSAAPTWVVGYDPAHPWGLDPTSRVAAALRAHYRQVATVCGRPVWLHDAVARPLAPAPSAGCGSAGL